MFFADRMTLDTPRRSAEGYLGAHAKSARSGVYQYLGREVDPAGEHFAADAVVNVYRSPDEVFNPQALGSFVAKPITDDHPSTAVTATNWRDVARGTVMGAVKDGDYVGFDLAFLDAAIVDSLNSGKRELSCGYSSEIAIGDGIAPDGTKFQARQVAIKGNHVALVERGRAGSTCRVSDAAICEAMPSDEVRALLTDERTYSGGEPAHKTEPAINGGGQVATKTITFDGLPLEVTDAAEMALAKQQKAIDTLTADKAKVATDLSAANTTLAARDAEIVTLKKAVEDAKVTPAQLRDQAKAYSIVCDKAKALEVKFADDADAGTIMKAVVDAKMGDTAKDYDDKQIAAAFDVLTKDAKVVIDPVRNALTGGIVNVDDGRSTYDAAVDQRRKDISSAWKAPAPANAA